MTISINISGETVEIVQRKLRDMAAALGTVAAATPSPAQAASDAMIAKGKEIVKAAEASKKSEKAAPAPSDASSPTLAPAPESAPTTETQAPAAIEYKTVGDAINAAAKIDKQAVIDILAKFGAKRGTELKPDQYAAVLEALKAVA